MKNILIINSGSSSLKFQLIQMPDEKVLASGLMERIGLQEAKLHFKTGKDTITEALPVKDHAVALKAITNLLMDSEKGIIKNVDDIAAIGHRVVHGGDNFSKTIVINKEVKTKIKDFFSLAPLHNPANLKGIEVAEELFPNAKQVAVFDTAFHRSIPRKAAQYAIPNNFFEKDHIQLYGFHGTSHKYVTEKAIGYLKNKHSKIISIHLGNGCSITAVKDGKSVDHSLGFAPVNGLIMGTRSGDIDQSVIFYLVNQLGYSIDEVSDILHKKSGMYGITGYSDLRDIEEQAAKGNKKCQLALDMNAYRIKKYIGAYAAAMNGVDALVFTAGIGENSDVIRSLVCSEMDFFGIKLDEGKNKERSKNMRSIQADDATVEILVIPTNEELEIAKQAYELDMQV
ncbi:acetate/propionate family kinase [Salegentibacter sp. BLCTC]|uniref:acetate/propionate family kinase n=1 Tax=Salegentibacter sp. BLCTC TaxID=2697368 RepID=UPI00187B3CD4|nr:acetate kinase [Salegentibacter sp. BLCTC]MBE7641748.1 acetate/propionate family kinase [Salegentibacter sp. BLCTC]